MLPQCLPLIFTFKYLIFKALITFTLSLTRQCEFDWYLLPYNVANFGHYCHAYQMYSAYCLFIYYYALLMCSSSPFQGHEQPNCDEDVAWTWM